MEDERPVFGWRPSPRWWVALDALVAAGYAAVLLSSSRSSPGPPGWAVLLILGSSLPLAFRRRWPVPVFLTVLACSTVGATYENVRDPFLAAAYALYPVAVTVRRRRREPTAGIAFFGAAGAVSLFVSGAETGSPASRIPGQVVAGVVVLSAAWTAGRAVRERRAQAAKQVQEATDHAVAVERLRIARELHDVVAHSMGVIAVKAGVANHVAEARPEEASDALRVIEETSRTALAEMRQLLGVLRSEEDQTEPLTSAPGLEELGPLTDRAAAAGVDTTLELRGEALVPAGVGLSVYRIVQEALTNVVRHAAPARCRISVVADARQVRIQVTDDGDARTGGQPGHGLIGMRERVSVYGGTLTAGPCRPRGFRVDALLPYDGQLTGAYDGPARVDPHG